MKVTTRTLQASHEARKPLSKELDDHFYALGLLGCISMLAVSTCMIFV